MEKHTAGVSSLGFHTLRPPTPTSPTIPTQTPSMPLSMRSSRRVWMARSPQYVTDKLRRVLKAAASSSLAAGSMTAASHLHDDLQ